MTQSFEFRELLIFLMLIIVCHLKKDKSILISIDVAVFIFLFFCVWAASFIFSYEGSWHAEALSQVGNVDVLMVMSYFLHAISSVALWCSCRTS